MMTPAQCRAGRALINWSQTRLAKAAELGLSTVVDFERSRREVSADAVRAMQVALQRAGVEFISQTGVNFQTVVPGTGFLQAEELNAGNDD